MKKIFHIVGAGRVGQTFAALLSRHPDWQLSHIISNSLPPNAFGATVLADMTDLPPADVVIIATPDNAIEATAERLAREVELSPQTLVLHLSGAQTIQVLQAVTAQGALAGSLHPVFAFANVEHSVAHLAGNLCAIEAEQAQAVEILQQLANALGANDNSKKEAKDLRYCLHTIHPKPLPCPESRLQMKHGQDCFPF